MILYSHSLLYLLLLLRFQQISAGKDWPLSRLRVATEYCSSQTFYTFRLIQDISQRIYNMTN